jgi:hypothetical protein
LRATLRFFSPASTRTRVCGCWCGISFGAHPSLTPFGLRVGAASRCAFENAVGFA